MTIGGKFNAVGSQHIQRIDGFMDGRIHIGKRQCGAELESRRMVALDLGATLVHLADYFAAAARLRGTHGQHRTFYSGFVHEFDLLVKVPFGQRETFIVFKMLSLDNLEIFRRDDVAMHIHRTTSLDAGKCHDC